MVEVVTTAAVNLLQTLKLKANTDYILKLLFEMQFI